MDTHSAESVYFVGDHTIAFAQFVETTSMRKSLSTRKQFAKSCRPSGYTVSLKSVGARHNQWYMTTLNTTLAVNFHRMPNFNVKAKKKRQTYLFFFFKETFVMISTAIDKGYELVYITEKLIGTDIPTTKTIRAESLGQNNKTTFFISFFILKHACISKYRFFMWKKKKNFVYIG